MKFTMKAGKRNRGITFLFGIFCFVIICFFILPSGESRVLLVAGGDCLLDRRNGAGKNSQDMDLRWQTIRAACEQETVFLCNLETTIGVGGTPKDKRFVFRAPPQALKPLLDFPQLIVALANNHSLDYGTEGLLETLSELNRARIQHAGAGITRTDAQRGTTVTSNGIKISVLSFGFDTDPEAYSEQNGACISPLYRPEAVRAVSYAASTSDLTVVMLHWGVEYDTMYNQSQADLAHELVKAGADVILGTGPHVLQGIELYKGAFICYSLGNLIFDDLGNSDVSSTLLVRVVARGANGAFSYEISPLKTYDHTHGPTSPSPLDIEKIIQNVRERSPDPYVISRKNTRADNGLRWYRVRH